MSWRKSRERSFDLPFQLIKVGPLGKVRAGATLVGRTNL
jgi:hypothetical protein